jgi:hypothetical protein
MRAGLFGRIASSKPGNPGLVLYLFLCSIVGSSLFVGQGQVLASSIDRSLAIGHVLQDVCRARVLLFRRRRRRRWLRRRLRWRRRRLQLDGHETRVVRARQAEGGDRRHARQPREADLRVRGQLPRGHASIREHHQGMGQVRGNENAGFFLVIRLKMVNSLIILRNCLRNSSGHNY